jgi:adenosylcobyric acid synthase
VAGYEIHHGRTLPLSGLDRDSGGSPLRVVMADTAGRPLGWGLCDGSGRARIWGSYLHGLFDADDFRHAFLSALRQDAGLPALAGTPYSLGPELDRLADTVEKSLDMQAIYGLLGLC